MTEKNFTVNSGLVVKNGLTVEGGTIDFSGASSGGGIELTDLSATTVAAGTTGLAYDNTTGVFTYTPADLSSYATTASLATVATTGAYSDLTGTPSLSGYLTDITGESLYSLSNVYTSSSPTDGQVLTWDNANSYWKPTTVSAGSTFAGADYFKINPALVSAASATGSDAISVGRGGQGSASYSTQVGSAGFITSSGSYGSAYGWNANVSAVGGTAIGAMAAIGANENYSTTIGYGSGATAANQLMLGATSGNGAFTSILVGNSSYTPTQSMDLTTKDYVDTAVAGAGGGGSSGGLGSYGTVNSTGTAASATGTEAVAIGAGSSSTSSYGVALGFNAEAEGGNRKVSIGYYAGYNAPDGHDTISMGNFGGAYHQGDYNVFIGSNAGKNSPTFTSSTLNKNYNVGIGYNALQATGSLASTCYKNTAIGSNSMGQGQLSGGGDNTALGYYSLVNCTTGSNNTILGSQAGWAITSGTNNVMIGYNAGTFNSSSRTTSGGNNTFVGARTYGSSATQFHEVVIGYGQYGRGYDTAIIAASSGAYNTGNTSTWSTASDERVKKNITDYTAGLTALNQINVKSFDYKTDEEIATANPELTDEEGEMHLGLPQGKTDVGIIAQELEAVFPNCVRTGESGLKTVNKDELFWVMLNAIKELSAKNDALEARIVALENA